ncbi:MAG: hypothetical protein KatS3mg011_1907 [Acidimicrobiia bacterium]|nr:MAG: hypothetical protein KatS3mg011_1907 [Acidimicrobiia bacterium]
MTRFLSVLLLVVGLTPIASPPPDPIPSRPTPSVTAQAWILYDDTFDLVLAEEEADQRRPMASTTKIMTALVALRHSEPGELVAVSRTAADVGESEIGLVAGERLPMAQLLSAMLVRSANDAAMAVAEHIGGTVDGFVEMMNSTAQELGLTNTHFANPHGLDAPDHYSSARDLLRLTLAAMDDPRFAQAVSSVRVRLPDSPSGAPRVAETTNRLLRDYPGAIGVKTGFTSRAGLVLVAAAERDGRRLYAVVMGSTDHFGDATALLDHGFSAYPLLSLTADQPVPSPGAVAAWAHLVSLGLDGSTGPAWTRAAEAPRPVEPALADLGDAWRWTIEAVGG